MKFYLTITGPTEVTLQSYAGPLLQHFQCSHRTINRADQQQTKHFRISRLNACTVKLDS